MSLKPHSELCRMSPSSSERSLLYSLQYGAGAVLRCAATDGNEAPVGNLICAVLQLALIERRRQGLTGSLVNATYSVDVRCGRRGDRAMKVEIIIPGTPLHASRMY